MHVVCFCCVRFSFSALSQAIVWDWDESHKFRKWPILWTVGRKLNQSETYLRPLRERVKEVEVGWDARRRRCSNRRRHDHRPADVRMQDTTLLIRDGHVSAPSGRQHRGRLLVLFQLVSHRFQALPVLCYACVVKTKERDDDKDEQKDGQQGVTGSKWSHFLDVGRPDISVCQYRVRGLERHGVIRFSGTRWRWLCMAAVGQEALKMHDWTMQEWTNRTFRTAEWRIAFADYELSRGHLSSVTPKATSTTSLINSTTLRLPQNRSESSIDDAKVPCTVVDSIMVYMV